MPHGTSNQYRRPKKITVHTTRSSHVNERKRTEKTLKEQYPTLRAIIDSADALIFSVDTQYCYTSFNSAHATVMKKIYGKNIEMGRSLLDYMTVPEDREKAKRNLDRALAGQSLVEEAYSGEEGLSRRYFQVSHYPISETDENDIGVAVLSKDVTELKKAEDALRGSEKNYRIVSENIPVAVYAALPDEHSTNTFTAGRIEELTGYSTEDYVKDQYYGPKLFIKTIENMFLNN